MVFLAGGSPAPIDDAESVSADSGRPVVIAVSRPTIPLGIGLLVSGSDFNADVAQLVERHLAKVKVAGSIPVVRSKTPVYQGF